MTTKIPPLPNHNAQSCWVVARRQFRGSIAQENAVAPVTPSTGIITLSNCQSYPNPFSYGQYGEHLSNSTHALHQSSMGIRIKADAVESKMTLLLFLC